MTGELEVVVCEGDETGQELLEEALRVLDVTVTELPIRFHRFDLSLASRRRSNNRVVLEAAELMEHVGLGLKAATITPPDAEDVGSPNRILREAVGGSVILRTGRRIPGVAPLAPLVHPIAIVRMAVGDAYGARESRSGTPGGADEVAFRVERITRRNCRETADYAFLTAASLGGVVYGGPKWTVSPTYEGMLREEMDRAAARHPLVEYRPALIDATYAGLVAEASQRALVVPALNRDGDCLSDLVLALFGSIAGAESVLLALDDDLQPRVAMVEAPHGTAPTLAGRNLANPMGMLLACAALLEHAGRRGHATAHELGHRLREATFTTAAAGTRTFDLGGTATTSEFVDEVIDRMR